MAIFLLTMAFIVGFIPQLTLPYEGTEGPVVAERATSDLAFDLLAEHGSQSELNETCTLAFFDGSAGDGCAFDSGEPVVDRLGIDTAYSVNVTLRDNPSDRPDSAILCDENGTVDECGSNPDRLAVGPTPPDSDESVATGRRVVFVNGTDGALEVVIW